jgi:hypothetical protein
MAVRPRYWKTLERKSIGEQARNGELRLLA